MFKEIIDEYADRRLELKLRINDSKCKLAVSSAELNENISNSLNGQVLVLHENQKKIDLQCKVLRNEAEKLALHNQNWLKMYSKLNHSLKQVGDLNNWAFMLEKEMAEVSAAITKLVSK
jgi:hypothetical protein